MWTTPKGWDGVIDLGHEVDAEMDREGGAGGLRHGDPRAEILKQVSRPDELEKGARLTSAFETTALVAIMPAAGAHEARRAAVLDRDPQRRGLEPHLAAAFLDRLDQDVG